ncbi:hypothetical protein HK101_002683 [Irineochytrium annulatum]|nr:hypothetical protein HK101_002683 [Irineochytrium annulatum]
MSAQETVSAPAAAPTASIVADASSALPTPPPLTAATAAATSSPAPAFPITPEYIAFLNQRLSQLTPQEIVDWAIVSLPGLVQSTAFGITGLAIRDMIDKSEARKKLGADVPLIFVDTLYHFEETLALAKAVSEKYSTPLHVYKPEGFSTAAEFEAANGERLWETDADIYDYLVKVEPQRRAVLAHNAQVTITGRRRSQGSDRAAIPILEIDNTVSPPLLKLNVLADWDYKAVWRYVIKNGVPYNALHDRGYKSVGDWHSTAPTGEGEGERDGRWKGQAKTECGLHKDYSKMRSSYVAAVKRKSQAQEEQGEEGREAKAVKVDA